MFYAYGFTDAQILAKKMVFQARALSLSLSFSAPSGSGM